MDGGNLLVAISTVQYTTVVGEEVYLWAADPVTLKTDGKIATPITRDGNHLKCQLTALVVNHSQFNMLYLVQKGGFHQLDIIHVN